MTTTAKQPFNPYMRGVEAMEDLIQDLNTLTVDTETRLMYTERLLLLRDMFHHWRKEELEATVGQG